MPSLSEIIKAIKTFLSRRPLVSFGIAALILIGVPLLLYVRNFWGTDLSKEPVKWGAFGSFLNPFISILNLFVVVYIAYLVNHYQRLKDEESQREERQLALACDLLREWMSDGMYKARTKADCYLKQEPIKKLDVLEHDHSLEMVDVWIVIGFFQRLEVLRSHKQQITDQQIRDIFGQIFTWWDVICFQPQLPDYWDSYLRIEELRKALAAVTSTDVMSRWNQLATQDRERRVQAQ